MIRQVSDQEVRAALVQNAEPFWRGTQGWAFGGLVSTWHPESEALDITRVCLMLGQPVSDIITSRMWLALLNEMLDQQLAIKAIQEAGVAAE